MREMQRPSPLRAHLLDTPPESALRSLSSSISPDVDVTLGEAVPQDVHVLVTGRPTRGQLDAPRDLRALIVPYAGIPAETRQRLITGYPSLPVYNLHHNAVAASELGVALLLATAKTLLPVDRRFRTGDWRSRYDGAPTVLLAGKTAVVLGLGAIGLRVANCCHALGMQVVAVRRRPQLPHPDAVEVRGSDALHQVLPNADVLIVTVPLTPDTEGWIGPAEIDLLPSTCLMVNIARGAIVDEEALYRALVDGRIAGAGLDVWYQYPPSEEARASTLPSRYPFHELDQVVMSPHRGGAFRVEELEMQRMADLGATLLALAHGADAPHRVDLEAGY